MINYNSEWAKQERKRASALKRMEDFSAQIKCARGCGNYITKREFQTGESNWHIDKSNWGGPNQPKFSECLVCNNCWKDQNDQAHHSDRL